jgi:hypothetical protein
MMPPEPQFARGEVLRFFNHAQIYLCLGAAITTVGLLAGSFWGIGGADLHDLRIRCDSESEVSIHL